MSDAPRRRRRRQRILILTAVLLAGLAGVLAVTRAVQDAHVRTVRSALRGVTDGAMFTPALVDDLPSPVQRYFLRAIRPGTPLAKTVEVEMTGELRLAPDKPWLPFRARQIIAAERGFIWEAAADAGATSIRGADSYFNGRGKTSFSLWGILPVINASGADIDRSAAGRFVLEHCFLPSALLPSDVVRWEALDGKTAQATVVDDSTEYVLTLLVDGDGSLLLASMPRWGDSGSPGEYGMIPFGCEITGESTFDGYTIPTAFKAGWWYGTDNYFEFFRAQITRAAFR